MNSRTLSLIAGGGSAALLAGAFTFQLLGYAPCHLCLLQRYPHGVAVAIGLMAYLIPARLWAWLGALAAATTSGIGGYHTGVEHGWWEGPANCTGAGAGLTGLSGADLLSVDAPRLILCDQVAWEFAGISMAGWNALFSAVLVVVWIMAARRR